MYSPFPLVPMTGAISFNLTYVNPYKRVLLDIFNGLPWLTRYPPPRELHFGRVSKTLNFCCPTRLQNPIRFDVDKYVATRILFLNAYRNFYPILKSTCLFLQLSVSPTSHMTPHIPSCICPYVCCPTDLLYSLPVISALPQSGTYVFLHFRKQFWTF